MSVAYAIDWRPDVLPVEMVELTPRKLWIIAVCPAAALITVLEKSMGLA
jgi:hypothetical protein